MLENYTGILLYVSFVDIKFRFTKIAFFFTNLTIIYDITGDDDVTLHSIRDWLSLVRN
jgi:hypothetical protein